MKTSICKYIGKFWIEAGWFRGNEPCVFQVQIGQTIGGFSSKIGSVVLFKVQIAKAIIDCGISFE